MNDQSTSATSDDDSVSPHSRSTTLTDAQAGRPAIAPHLAKHAFPPPPVAPFASSTASPAAARRTAAASVADLAGGLDRVLEDCQSTEESITACAAFLRRYGATFVGRYSPPGRRIGETERLDGLTAPAVGLDTQLQATLVECATQALAAGRQTTIELHEAAWIQAVPFQSQPNEALTIVSDATAASREALSVLTGLAAARLSEKQLQQQVEFAERGSRHAAALVELMAHLDQCRDLHDGAGRLSRELQRYLEADRVAVGYCDGSAAPCTLVADTAQETINVHTEDTRLLQAALEESIGRDCPSAWPDDNAENRHALLAQRQLVRQLECEAVVACPLACRQGQTLGAIVVVFAGRPPDDTEQAADSVSTPSADSRELPQRAQHAHAFLAASASPVAATLSLLDRSSPGLWQHVRRVWRRTVTGQRRRTAGIVTAVVTALLLVPMRYKIDCDAELQPVRRRFVASPFDGTLRRCLVRPGDFVEQGTVLAVMDDREIQYELAGIQADMSGARTERYAYMAEQKSGEAAIARHEFERLRHRSDLLTFRSENLELRSPIDGIVVSGDHKNEEGVPLQTGDTLFEIAPLSSMIIEVAVPEEDIRWVREGMSVQLQLEAMPASLIRAKVERIYPRAELKKNDTIFIVEAEISNDSGLLRPGMRGHAKIHSDRHTLGWNLFHKPAAWLVGWLGW